MKTDGVDEPLDYRVALTIAGDEVTADYSWNLAASSRARSTACSPTPTR